MLFGRLVSAGLILSMLAIGIPLPASATSTPAEVAQAKEIDKQVIEQYNIVNDPLLNGWANDIGQKLWNETARKDVPYNVKVLDAQDINAFTIGGGYIYVNEETLDFVQSDDELAGVIGHETGHNERRHTVTLPAKAQALDLIFGIASLFSPFIYQFGQLFEAGIIAKQERADELQADQYGLMLMTRAGYDPDAMVSFMKHLGAVHDETPSAVDKYFADHPGVPDRVKHLVGYEQLDPTKRTNEQILVQAIHDQDTARYAIAARKFAQVLKADPGNPIALAAPGPGANRAGSDREEPADTGRGRREGHARDAQRGALQHKGASGERGALHPDPAEPRAAARLARGRQGARGPGPDRDLGAARRRPRLDQVDPSPHSRHHLRLARFQPRLRSGAAAVSMPSCATSTRWAARSTLRSANRRPPSRASARWTKTKRAAWSRKTTTSSKSSRPRSNSTPCPRRHWPSCPAIRACSTISRRPTPTRSVRSTPLDRRWRSSTSRSATSMNSSSASRVPSWATTATSRRATYDSLVPIMQKASQGLSKAGVRRLAIRAALRHGPLAPDPDAHHHARRGLSRRPLRDVAESAARARPQRRPRPDDDEPRRPDAGRGRLGRDRRRRHQHHAAGDRRRG
jgi:Zn-dependent protease with chaperone function